MAFLLKNTIKPSVAGASHNGWAVLQQQTQVQTAGRVLPATTTDQIFRVKNGRVLVHLLIGQCTTVCSATVTTLKISSKALSAASVAIGTAVDLCSALAVTSAEAGSLFIPVGSGGAPVLSNAGAGIATLGRNAFVLPQGEVYLTTSATNTGAFQWDIFYQPIDFGAYVESVTVATAAI